MFNLLHMLFMEHALSLQNHSPRLIPALSLALLNEVPYTAHLKASYMNWENQTSQIWRLWCLWHKDHQMKQHRRRG